MTPSEGHPSRLGPHFVCIGAQKAGTGWLYEQLREHPDFWMPPMKELHYFDRIGTARNAVVSRTLPLARSESDRIRIARRRARDDHDRRFLDQFEQLSMKRSVDLEGYADLFRIEDRITGDITPGYSTISDELIEPVVHRFATTRIIFIVRDPVERAWSQLSMYVRRGLIPPFSPDDIDKITAHLKLPEVQSRSYSTDIVRRWKRRTGEGRFGLFFFDDLKRDPRALRASIITFLGGDPAKQSGLLEATHNAKAEKQKLPLTDIARSHLASFFAAELRACATELGGPAVEWPRRYGL